MFNNVGSISLPTIARILKRHQVSIKQLNCVPFERNADRVKQMRTEYVQRVMELDAEYDHHKFIYLDEAGFNLAKTSRRGRNFIGQRATIQVPGQRGANITMCAAISEDGVVGRRPHIGPYNAALLVTFLDELDQTEEFFSAWRWKVHDRHPHEQVTLLQAMDDACNDITADQCQAWIRYARSTSKQVEEHCI
ncbi:uncharacterized protein LOC123977049 isoform X2 [Micropterus dolomieu]|uniref:uncharacterized protein LOC123977049 isoform X2 n=1 Tax=Micropterus dolomieu TaxID=147949 RepID=UPI001E8E5B55|nr:uncharacterized protein LOC123977049 isoform X2 [Micropterus dolomieu]